MLAAVMCRPRGPVAECPAIRRVREAKSRTVGGPLPGTAPVRYTVAGPGMRSNVDPPLTVCRISVGQPVTVVHGDLPSTQKSLSLIALNATGWNPAGIGSDGVGLAWPTSTAQASVTWSPPRSAA